MCQEATLLPNLFHMVEEYFEGLWLWRGWESHICKITSQSVYFPKSRPDGACTNGGVIWFLCFTAEPG